MKKSKKKSHKLQIFIIVLGVIILIGAIVFFANRKNIVAVVDGISMSQDEIEERQRKNDKKTEDLLGQLTDSELKEIPEELRESYKNKYVTKADLRNYVLGNVSKEELISSTEAKEEPKQEKAQNRNTDDIIADIYVLRVDYLNRIDSLISGTKKAYYEIRSKTTNISPVTELAKKAMAQGEELEKSCDSEMEELIDEIKASISDSDDIIKQIRETYDEEKKLKKAELVNKYSGQ